MYSLELKKRRSAGRLKQTASDGKVKFFPLKSEQIEWIFQRESPPSGSFKDICYSPRVQYKCYETIKATKREDSSVDLELLDSKYPPFNLSYQAWTVMRREMNDAYDQFTKLDDAREKCSCPRFSHARNFNITCRWGVPCLDEERARKQRMEQPPRNVEEYRRRLHEGLLQFATARIIIM